jgi:hypothetical protein
VPVKRETGKIIKGLGKGSGVRVIGRGPAWVEVIVTSGRFAGREWTLNPDEYGTG